MPRQQGRLSWTGLSIVDKIAGRRNRSAVDFPKIQMPPTIEDKGMTYQERLAHD